MAELPLAGCAPTPLASYLKALAVLRLVSMQADAGARGRWSADVFVLDTALSADELVGFFLDRYAPSPVVSPWNGGSGFHPKDQRAALERIERDGSARLACYRQTIAAAREAVGAGLSKAELVSRCRATFPDAALDWLDAALVLMPDGLSFPPLLLSGGNDGRLEFSNNFMQRLCDVLPELAPDDRDVRRRSTGWLESALFSGPSPALREGPVGMFNPGSAGGANATAGFEGASLVNPWDYVLMIEGALLFAGAAARRLSDGAAGARAAFPFTVEPSTAGVTAGASSAERARAEVWLPLWDVPSSLAEIRHLCAEGRAEWRGHQARDAVEFAQAVAKLGVARGVDDFVRYAIHQRMGRNHVATPAGRVQVRRRPEVDLLAGIDRWLRRFRDRVGENAPAALRERRHRLEQAIFDLCLHGGRPATRAVLVELGRAELALSRREELAGHVPALELSTEWLRDGDDGTAEFRLGAGLGSLGAGTDLPLRANLEPVAFERGHWVRRPARLEVGDVVPAEERLAVVLRRRLLDARIRDDARLAFEARRTASLQDVSALLLGDVAVGEMVDLANALSLVRWRDVSIDDTGPAELPPRLPRACALLKLCCLPFAFELDGREYDVPVEPGVLAALEAGQVREALRRAAVRLRGSGLRPHAAAASPELAGGLRSRLLLSALLVPISRGSAAVLAASVSIKSEVST